MPDQHQSHKLVIFDVDETIINTQSQQLLLPFMWNEGVLSTPALLYIYSWFLLYKMGLLSNPEKVGKFAYSQFQGYEASYLEPIFEIFFKEHIKHLIYQSAREKIKMYKNSGSTVLIISNSLHNIVYRIADHMSVKNHIATKLETRNGVYTGNICNKIATRKERVRRIKEFINQSDKHFNNTVYYGDHHSDKEALLFSDESYVVNPNKTMQNFALKNNLNVVQFN